MINWISSLLTIFFIAQPVIAAESPVRIGWQIPWATQGQIVQIFKHTDILKKNGISAEFIGRTYGPELNEMALAGAVDVILTADQPAILLFSKDKGWKAIGRLMYNRTATYVPVNSPIQTVADLKGKRIGVPIGAAAERILKDALHDAGMDPKKDVSLSNLGILEHTPLISKNAKAKTWGDFDALAGFDPVPAILESKKMVRTVHTGKVVSLVLMNETLSQRDPAFSRKMMQALVDAYDYYRKNTEQANRWFLAEAKLSNGDQRACEIAAQLEPNLKVSRKSDIRVTLSPEDLKTLDEVAVFLQPQTKTRVNVAKYIDGDAVKKLK